MNVKELQLAIGIPRSLLTSLGEYVAGIETEDQIEMSIIPVKELRSKGIIDPGIVYETMSQWVILSVTGKAVYDLAVGIISNAIYDKLKQTEPSDNYVVTIRTPDGLFLSIDSTGTLDFDELAKFLNKAIYSVD